MTAFLQFAILGLGAGAAYALFAQGAVLIYRGSGLVNFAHGALGMLSAYVCFVTLHEERGWPIGAAFAVGVLASVVVALAYQYLVLRRLRNAAAIVRLISTLALLAVVQAGVELKYGGANRGVDDFLPNESFNWGGVRVGEDRIYVTVIAVVLTVALWAFARHTRVGLAISASAQNERAVQTLGWSPDRLSALTWAMGAALAGVAGILVAPFTGLSTTTFTLVVTVAALAAALLGGFQSFPLTLLGGIIVGVGENLATNYKLDVQDFLHTGEITGLNRAVPFLLILLVLVVRGKSLPLRSHISDRLPRLGTGRINVRGVLAAAAVLLVLLFTIFDEKWASATYVSLTAGVMVLSVVVLTGYAGQLSLAQWALGGVGTLIAGRLVQAQGWPMELAFLTAIVLTIPAGLLFALPALRTRGVNLAVVTLGLGFTVYEAVLSNAKYLGPPIDAGTRVGPAKLFGIEVDSSFHPHRWAVVCLVSLVLVALLVANLRRSRTGRRLIAVRTNERAAASLGISVFGVKLYAFGVAAAIAALAGILLGFQQTIIQYGKFNVFESINSVGHAVIGGLGYVVGAAFGAPNAVGGFGTRIMEDLLSIDKWDKLLGGAVLVLIIVAHQDGVADGAIHGTRRLLRRLRLTPAPVERSPLPDTPATPAEPVNLKISNLVVRFGGVFAVDDVSFEVGPGEVVGLIGPNGAGKTTVIDAITGFVRPASGRLMLNGEPIERWSATRRARHGLRRSFQSLELFEDLSVEENIRAGADTGATRLSWLTDLFWPGRHPLPSTAVAAIREFDLEAALDQLPGELPYGRRRLVGIARAAASGPSILMLDEPAAGLDEAESRELASLIRRLASERRIGVLLVEHDVGLVMRTCDRIVVIDFGRIIAAGTPSEVRSDPAVLAAYLGTSEGHDDVDHGPEDPSLVRATTAGAQS
jgi:ABC-type branched-subunit amino acid transport system ATPase component/branched-subunit amino acid ABC-type transport system permease component